MPFRHDFLWGVATSAYQIEGAAADHARGLSVWDALCRTHNAIADASSGEIACDHANRVAQDVGLMRNLGIDAYRLSISWPRVIPDGDGAPSPAGLDFYDALIDTLLDNGIRPFVTLFHWDFPLALQHKGGWLSPDAPRCFADYASLVATRLSDRVTDWITHNEPQCFVALGHRDARHAPGLKLPPADVLTVAHHALLAHGHATRAIRAAAKREPNIGWASLAHVKYPASNTQADIDAARAAQFGPSNNDWAWSIDWFGDPIHLGHYPEHTLSAIGHDMPRIKSGDMETINAPIDFIGLNIYSGTPHAADDDAPRAVAHPPGHAITTMDWAVAPQSMRWGPAFVAQRYGVPIFITENGMSNPDWVALDGGVHDPQRIDFLTRYLDALETAADDGVDVRGYFLWSLLDNFEWAEGYKKRFGIVHVDFETLERTPKDSFEWYRNRIIDARDRASSQAVHNGDHA